MKQFAKYPTMKKLALGLTAGAFLALPSASVDGGGRQQLGQTITHNAIPSIIVGFSTIDNVPVTIVEQAKAQAPASTVLAGYNVTVLPHPQSFEVDGLRPVADDLAAVSVNAADYTKDDLIGLAAAAGVEVAGRWTKAKIVDALNAYYASQQVPAKVAA